MRWSRQILFGDVDAMFASAAVVKDPSLAGKPVAVGGPPPRGIIAAASYAVRPFGIHSAMPTAKALQLCPNLILLPPDPISYSRSPNGAASTSFMPTRHSFRPAIPILAHSDNS